MHPETSPTTSVPVVAQAANGVLRIAHPTKRVRDLIERAGLLKILCGDSPCCYEQCS